MYLEASYNLEVFRKRRVFQNLVFRSAYLFLFFLNGRMEVRIINCLDVVKEHMQPMSLGL